MVQNKKMWYIIFRQGTFISRQKV